MESASGAKRGRRGPVAHPQREKAYARPLILDAARKLFKSERYHTISTERIAATAQVTRHTLNNHFSSKEDIFRCSRELLLTEVADQIKDGIPSRMDMRDGILFFLEHCFSVFSSDSNLELIKSIVDNDDQQLWLVEAHQRRIRLKLVAICETYILYRASRTDVLLSNPQVISEQLLMVAEAVVYGPYARHSGNSQPPSWRAKQFSVAARAVETLLLDQRTSAIPVDKVKAHRLDSKIG